MKCNKKQLYMKWKEHMKRDDCPNLKINEKDYISLLKNIGFKSISVKFRRLSDAIIVAEK